MINHKFDREKTFQEILYSVERYVNKGSSWVFEKIHFQFINVSHFRPLSGSSYIKLPAELKNSQKVAN